MNFRRGASKEELEINLIPLIDVLLVILIFLMVTTTYSRYAELQINLPTAEANPAQERPNQINVSVSAQGSYAINKSPITFRGSDLLADDLKQAAGAAPDPVVIVNADAGAPYQAVVNIMEAARIAGYNRITFTTQATKK